jgi:hypothetical protein
MGVDKRTITADQTMFNRTIWTLTNMLPETPDLGGTAKSIIEDPGTRLGGIMAPGYGVTWESDGDFRTQHFSQRYSRLLYSLFSADQRVAGERYFTGAGLGKMWDTYAATESENERAVFDVPLPPKLTD